MKHVFVGGPGRSGTSAFVHRLQGWRAVTTFVDTELKLYSELDGIWDLYWSFVECYSPQRAAGALARFRNLFADISGSGPGFVGLGDHLPAADIARIVEGLAGSLTTPAGVPRRTGPDDFFSIVREMAGAIGELASFDPSVSPDKRLFVEKTPHCLLRIELLERIGLDATYIHVMRDPRLVARSLSRMPWGPGSLEACCDWVSEYIFQMQEVFAKARASGIVVHSFFIESVARDGPAYARYLLDLFGLDEDPGVFNSLDPATLMPVSFGLEDADVQLLNSRLGELAASMGYDALNPGERRAGLTDRLEVPLGLDGAGWH